MCVSDIHTTESVIFTQPVTDQMTVVATQHTDNINNNNMGLPQDVMETQGTRVLCLLNLIIIFKDGAHPD